MRAEINPLNTPYVISLFRITPIGCDLPWRCQWHEHFCLAPACSVSKMKERDKQSRTMKKRVGDWNERGTHPTTERTRPPPPDALMSENQHSCNHHQPPEHQFPHSNTLNLSFPSPLGNTGLTHPHQSIPGPPISRVLIANHIQPRTES